MTQNNGMIKGLLIGLIAGGAIGSVLALLYAPKSGKELRADLKERADDFLGDAEEYLKTARSKASQIVSDARERSDQLMGDAQRRASTLMEDADRIISGAKEKATTVVEEGNKIKNAVKAGVDAFNDERKRS